jgi:hypothetical protein
MLGSTITPFEVQVSWTNPGDADLAGVLLAGALGAPPAFTPVNGTTYTAGTPLPNDGEIVFVGAGTSFSAPAPIGDVYVAAYAFDAARNYSPVTSGMLTITEPPQTGSIQVSLAGTVTVTQQPSLLFLSGTATYNGGAMQLDIDLSVRNDTPRLLLNLKAVASNLNQGTITGDGTFAGDPYVFYGPEGQDTGSTVMRTITVNGVTGGTDPITLDLEFVHHQMFVLQNDGPSSTPALTDASGSGERTDLDTDNLTAFYQDSNHPGAVFSPDNRWLYLANGNQPALVAVDMTTLAPALTTDLTGANMLQQDGLGSVGMTHGLEMSPDGEFLYTAFSEGLHSYSTESGQISGTGPSRLGATTSVYLVKIDRETLSEVSRVLLFTGPAVIGDAKGGKGLSLSADGARAAVCILRLGTVFVVDTATMTIFDADLVAPGAQGFDVSAHSLHPRASAFSGDGTRVYVAHAKDLGGAGNPGDLDVLDLTTRTVSMLPMSAAFAGISTNRIGCLRRAPNGDVYYTHQLSGVPGLTIVSGGVATDVPLVPQIGELRFDPDGQSYWIMEYDGTAEARRFTIPTNMPIPFPATGLDAYQAPGSGFHCVALSPF